METQENKEITEKHIEDKLPICGVMPRLKAIQTIRQNKELIKILAEFKRANFSGSYIMSCQAETEEELAGYWLRDLENTIFRQNGA